MVVVVVAVIGAKVRYSSVVDGWTTVFEGLEGVEVGL